MFGNFQEAEKFAVEGKLNSSLETKYGNLFEKLFSAFANCRGIYDGGVDVAVDNNAFDIKSGLNVMNKSMVDAFCAKQVLIQERNILPDINSYKIALGYGKKEKLNSFMAKIDSEILTGREAWTQITGIPHSPELIFTIAGLVPQILGVNNLVSSLLGQRVKYNQKPFDDSKFRNLFDNCFDSIDLDKEAKDEIDKIESIPIPM